LPIYEYRCNACSKLSSFFVRTIGSAVEPVCSHCQSNEMERRMSSFATGKTEENFSTGSDHREPGYYNDPSNIGRGVEDAYAKFGKDMPQTVRDNIDAARSGETPKGMDL
tara:strand:+ start:194 stop:523 length:330 start_codon:yes stop_codon:yes gene_type:complete